MESLDGNGQLFLCLQDLTMDQFRNKLVNRNDASLIIVSDDEWDIGTVLVIIKQNHATSVIDPLRECLR